MDKFIENIVERGVPVSDCVAKIGDCPLVSTHSGRLYSKKLKQGDLREFENVDFDELKKQLDHFNHTEDIGRLIDINKTEEGINVPQVCEMENDNQVINILYQALDRIVALYEEHNHSDIANKAIDDLMVYFTQTIITLQENNND